MSGFGTWTRGDISRTVPTQVPRRRGTRWPGRPPGPSGPPKTEKGWGMGRLRFAAARSRLSVAVVVIVALIAAVLAVAPAAPASAASAKRAADLPGIDSPKPKRHDP